MWSKGHSAMDDAQDFQTGGLGLNPDTTKDFFQSWTKLVLPFSQVPSLHELCLSKWAGVPRKQVTSNVRGKKRGIVVENPSSAICEANTDIREMNGHNWG